MDGQIRPYRPEDTDAVIDVWTAANAGAHPFLNPDFVAREKERIRTRHLKLAETWVFERDGRVVGFIAMIGNEVGGLFVHPDAQRRGIGRALMDFVAARNGEIVLDVFTANWAGRAFYARYGFRAEYEHVHEETGQSQLRLRYPGRGGSAAPR